MYHFVIPVVIKLHGHIFEGYTLVSGILDNVEIVVGIRNVYETDGVIFTKGSGLYFLNRSIPFFLKTKIVLKPREQRFIKIYVTFIDKISGLVMINYLILKLIVLMQKGEVYQKHWIFTFDK